MISIGESLAQSRSRLDRTAAWVWDVLRQELKPYPGRAQIVVRMVLSSVIVMLIVMTFRIPGAALAGYYTLLLSRESPRATLAGAVELVVSFGAGVAYVMLSALLFFGSPVLHLLWVAGSLFLIFYVIRVLRSYSAAAGFGFLIATCIPIWERTIPGEAALEATLWTAADVTLGAIITVLIEYLFANLRRFGDLEQGLIERWESIEQAFLAWADGSRVSSSAQLHQFASVGVSRLRRIMIRSGATTAWIERMGTIIALTEHLIDLTAAVPHIEASPGPDECDRLRNAAERVRELRLQFIGQIPGPELPPRRHAPPAPCPMPLLPEMERTIGMLTEAVQGRVDPRIAILPNRERPSLLLNDAFTNPAHLRFALQGCLATVGCYIVYSAVGWPGLNTSVATCIVTALSSVGSSRQKQLLRVGGAIVGGFVFGMGAQISILTGMDSITAFTIYFAVVTAIAAWFSTASARLSYFGLQLALAFFLINLQEPAFQTSLVIARDRVLGILLGLFFMWLAFDLFSGGVRAAGQMLTRFHRALHLIARLQELSLASDAEAIALQASRIREDLIATFAALNTEADAILFETGRQREQDLALRERILAVQPTLRSLLLLQVTALQYRRQRLIHELPPVLATAQRTFDESVSAYLRHLADPSKPEPQLSPEEAIRNLESHVHNYYGEVSRQAVPHRAEAILALSDSIATSVHSLREAVVP